MIRQALRQGAPLLRRAPVAAAFAVLQAFSALSAPIFPDAGRTSDATCLENSFISIGYSRSLCKNDVHELGLVTPRTIFCEEYGAMAQGNSALYASSTDLRTLLAIDFDPGLVDETEPPNALRASSGASLVEDRWGSALRLSGGSEHVRVSRSADLIGNDAYTLLFDFKKSAAGGGGRLITFAHSFTLTAGATGLSARVVTDHGAEWIRVKDAALASTDWQSCALTFSGAAGEATLFLNGEAVGVIDGLDGATQIGSAKHDFLIGSPWGGGFAGLIDNVLFLDGAMSAEEVRAHHLAKSAEPPTPIVAAADAAIVAPGAAATIDVLANDSGHGTLAIAEATAPANGRVAIVDGALRYAPHAGFFGEDRFSYRVTDAAGAEAVAEVVVTVATVVHDARELDAALKAARGGELILLAPGDYGRLAIDGRSAAWAQYAEEVTLRSLDPARKASFGEMSLHSVRNMTFEGIAFDYVAAPDAADDVKPFALTAVSSVTIRDAVFDGDLHAGADPARAGFGTGHGLTVRDSADVVVENSVFFDWHRGAVFSHVQGLEVRGNEVHSVRSDGFDFVAVKNAAISGNYFHDFRASRATGDHCDMIQFWTNGTKTPTENVTISGNVFDSASGDHTQSLFMRNEEVDTGRAGEEMYYRNVVITDNLIRNGHLHGISVGEASGLVISGNTVAHSAATWDAGSVSVPRIGVAAASRDVTITNNLAAAVPAPARADWTVDGNLSIQRTSPDAPGYYGDLFVDGLADHRPAAEALRTYPGATRAGAPSAAFDTTPHAPDAFLFAAPLDGLARDAVAFRIGGVFDAGGAVAPAGARVSWSFGDGATSAEAAPVHRYAKAGVYDAAATIALADGRTLTASKTVAVETPVAALVTFNGGLVDRSDIPNAVSASAGVTFVADRWGDAARLPGGGETIKIARSGELIGHDDYTIMLDFKKDAASSGGRLVYFTNSFVLTAGADSLRADVTTDVKSGAITAKTSALTSTDWQHAALTFSGEDGVATLYLNGRAVGALTGLDGARQIGSASHDLHLGSPFGGGLSGLVDNFTFLRGALSAEQIRDVYEAARAQDAADLADAFRLDLPAQQVDGLW